jgi:hypothetical protein
MGSPAGGLVSAVRVSLVVAGCLALARGAYLVLFTLPPSSWLAIGLWLAIGVAAHDAVLAPLSLALGRALRPVLARPGLGGPLRGAWLATGTVLLIGATLTVGATHRANPTVLPGHPALNVLLALALIAAGTTLAVLLNLSRDQGILRPGASKIP